MKKRFFQLLADLVTKRNKALLISAIVLTVIMMAASGRLSMKTQIADMMPKGIPMVEEFYDIIEEYSSASSVMIAIESKEKDLDRMKTAAEEVANKLSSLKRITASDATIVQQLKSKLTGKPIEGLKYDTLELVKRIDYKVDNDFIAENGMIIQKEKDLANYIDMFSSLELPSLIENINNNLEKEFVNDPDNMTTLDGEEQAVQGLEGMYKFVEGIGTYIDNPDSAEVNRSVKKFVTGPEYFISSDNTVLLAMLQPTVDMNDFEAGMDLGYQIRSNIEEISKSFPDLEIGSSGWMILQIDEMNATKKDFGWPSLVVVILIFVLLFSSFRSWKNPLLSMATLIVAIIWVTGLIAVIFHYLDMMSASFGIILLGLGIDFGIHVISGFRDGREHGLTVEESIYHMYNKVGAGIITGGMTTAIVFFMLALTGFKAFVTMGVSVGLGIVTTLFAMMVLLPALIVRFNKDHHINPHLNGDHLPKALELFTAPFQFKFLGTAGKIVATLPVSIVVIIISSVLTYLSITNGKNIEFEYDMMELEPKGIKSGIVQDKILDKFEMASDFSLLKAKNLEECRNMVDELKKIGNRTELIGRVDAISEFIPSLEIQKKNIESINLFKNKFEKLSIPTTFSSEDREKLKNELIRLHQNIVEIGELSISGSGENNKIIRKCDQIVGKEDKDSKILALASKIGNTDLNKLTDYQKFMSSKFKSEVLTMTSTNIITLDNIPESIKERYVSPKTNQLLITVFPKGNIWDEKNLRKFDEYTRKVNDRITGTPAIMLLYMKIMGEKGRLALIMGTIAIMIFLLIDFKSFKYMIFALIPLAIGTVWMIGLMALFGVKFSMVNFMALPLIVGIGIDDGVHILHRYKLEGHGSAPTVLKFTGRAILLTSLTTIFGFGSMGFASHRGLAALGQVLSFGVGSCFLSSAFVLPAILTVYETVTDKINYKKEIKEESKNVK